MALSQTSVLKLYHAVIDDVIAGVRDSFLDEGVDEQVLQEMKQVWTSKLMASKAVELTIDPLEPQQPPIIANNPPKSKPNGTKSKSRPSQNAQREQQQQQQQQTQSQQHTLTAGSGTAPNSTGTQQQFQPTENNANIANRSNQSNTIQSNGPQKLQTHPQQSPINQANALPAQQQSVPPSVQQQTQQSAAGPPSVVIGMDPSKIVPIQITLPAQANGPNSEPRVLTIQVPASALQENQLHQALTATPIITSIMSLPPALASSVLQQHIDAVLLQNNSIQSIALRKQLDGSADTSDEDGSDVSDDNLDNDDEDDIDKEDEDEADIGAEEEPLNSDDDVSEEEQADLFDTDNVIVCQYDKITRSRNKWKFYLKDGIMNIGGKDYIFQKSNGDAEW